MNRFCGYCGKELNPEHSFCQSCGAARETILDAEILDESFMPARTGESNPNETPNQESAKSGLKILAVFSLILIAVVMGIAASTAQDGTSQAGSMNSQAEPRVETLTETQFADRRTCLAFWSLNIPSQRGVNATGPLENVQSRDNSAIVARELQQLINALNHDRYQGQLRTVSQITGKDLPENFDPNSLQAVIDADQQMEKICASVLDK